MSNENNFQVTLLHSISFVYEQLVDVLPVAEVTKLASLMLDSMPRETSPQLAQAKLIAIKNLVTSKLFQDDGTNNNYCKKYIRLLINITETVSESRNILLSNACKHLRYHLIRLDELKLCTDILGEILRMLFKQKKQCEELGKINNLIHHDVDTLCVNTLDVLIQTVLNTLFNDTKVIVSDFGQIIVLRFGNGFVPLGLFGRLLGRVAAIIGRISLQETLGIHHGV